MMPSGSSDDTLSRRLLGTFDTPAFIKRALRLEQEEEALRAKLEALRQEFLLPVRLALADVWRMTARISDLEMMLSATSFQQLLGLVEQVPDPRRQHGRFAPRLLRQRLRKLTAAVAAFNSRWRRALAAFDLSAYEKLVRDYNQYSLLERECALSSPRLAARGFVPRQPWTFEQLLERFPPLSLFTF